MQFFLARLNRLLAKEQCAACLPKKRQWEESPRAYPPHPLAHLFFFSLSMSPKFSPQPDSPARVLWAPNPAMRFYRIPHGVGAIWDDVVFSLTQRFHQFFPHAYADCRKRTGGRTVDHYRFLDFRRSRRAVLFFARRAQAREGGNVGGCACVSCVLC